VVGMPKETVTFRIDADTRAALDRLTATTDRDRGSLINDAVEAYLDVHNWQVTHIETGLAQAESGAFASEADVAALWKPVCGRPSGCKGWKRDSDLVREQSCVRPVCAAHCPLAQMGSAIHTQTHRRR
jgi:predicted transcriptional regulator